MKNGPKVMLIFAVS